MPNTYERLLEETLKQKVSEAAEQLMKSTSQEIDAELQRDMIGARIYYEDREVGERWLRMEQQKPQYVSTLRRHLKWDGDVLDVQDTCFKDGLDFKREILRAIDEQDRQIGEEILSHFQCDLSDLSTYLNDRTAWERKQKLAMPHWIPVTERLPESAERYLVMRFDYVAKAPFYDLLWFENGRWWNRHFEGDYAVTHWMPLPEPPKGEKED